MPKSRDSDSLSEQRSVSWTLLDLEELESAYWDHVAPAMQADGLDPQTERPTQRWLSDHDFDTLVYTLREHHDLTFVEFWTDVLGLTETADDSYQWGIEHQPTIDALEQYLDRQGSRLSWAERTVEAHRYRLSKYATAYAGVNGSEDLLTPVDPESDISAPRAVDECWDTFDALDRTVSRTTLQRIYRTVSNFYSTLVSRRKAALNPTEGLDYSWSEPTDTGEEDIENPPLDPEHVRALVAAAEDTHERLLIVALCAWGLRSSEVAGLHVDQLVLESETPLVQFDERKNGPGTVSVIYGAETARDRLAELSDRDDWSGYLFPSSRPEGHITRQSVYNHFVDLAERAGLPETIGGARPSPQMGRRFWYDRYSDTISELVETQIDEIAAEQGSASADVVWRDYLSEERRRDLRREFMRDKLAAAFDPDGPEQGEYLGT